MIHESWSLITLYSVSFTPYVWLGQPTKGEALQWYKDCRKDREGYEGDILLGYLRIEADKGGVINAEFIQENQNGPEETA